MAFQAPTAERRRISPIRVNPNTYHDEDFCLDPPSSPSLSRNIYTPAVEEEWVVFSPTISAEPSTTAAETVTNDASRTSEFGSLLEGSEEQSHRISSSNGPSYGGFDGTDCSEGTGAYEEQQEDDESHDDSYGEDDGKTDSLKLFQNRLNESPILLPAHDGRGMFPSISTSEGTRATQGLVSLEESLRLVAGNSKMSDQTNDLNSRIQKWRNEQKNALIEEIERNKKRNSKQEADEASLQLLGEEPHTDEQHSSSLESSAQLEDKPEEASETFLRRITRTLMRDIMGIDDNILEIIFGETLPTEAGQDSTSADGDIQQSWERSLLDRIARELGVLIQHYTNHPTEGAFSAYTRWGLDVAEEEDEGTKTPKPMEQISEQIAEIPAEKLASETESLRSVSSQVHFQPTLPQQNHELANSASWGIDDQEDIVGSVVDATSEAQRRKEYWEQELGVRVFFSYLKSRFTSPPPSPSRTRKPVSNAPPEPKPIYHQHPLIQRRYRRSVSSSSRAGPSPVYSPTTWSFGGALGLGGYRTGSSCTSESTRRSKKIASRSLSSTGKGKGKRTQGGSTISKGHYWEVDTSVGSGRSCVGVGVWGEI